MRLAAGSLLFCSGGAALIYQVVWVRLLALNIGATAVGVAAVLGAFFSGLALGSLFAQAALRRGMDGMRGFAWAEALTALAALLLLPLLLRLDSLLALWPVSGADSHWHLLGVMLLLLPPAVAMGATFPFLASGVVVREAQQGASLSRLYALNTLGAMCGSLLAGFWLIPRFGLDGAIYCAVALNTAVALATVALLQRDRVGVTPFVKGAVQLTGGAAGGTFVALATTGFSALASEVVWSKYLSLYAGTTIYGFAAMTAVMLAGMAGGAWLMQRWLQRQVVAISQLLMMLLLLSGALIMTRSALGWLPAVFGDTLLLGEALHSPLQFVLLSLVLIPASLCFGATFPLALALHCPTAAALRSELGSALAVNTLAAIAGAAVTALWLVPLLGSDTTLALLPLLPLVAAGWLMATNPALPRGAAIALALLLAPLAVMLPGIDYERLLSSTHYRYEVPQVQPPHFRYLQEGRSGVIALVDHGGTRVVLQRNGLAEGAVNAEDARQGALSEMLLGALPYLLQPQPRDALVIGFGAGTTTRLLAETGLEHVKVVELEPRVMEAMRQLGDEPWHFLSDGRAILEYDDARVNLRRSTERYSIIVSQPSHPWLAGAANLYSREFFALAHSRLRPGGIFAQWVNLFHMDAATLRSILRTFYEEFPRGAVFGVMKSGDLLLLGGDETMVLDYERSRLLYQKAQIQYMLRSSGFSDIRELPNHFLFTREEALQLGADAPVATDLNQLIEVQLARLNEGLAGGNNPYQLLQNVMRDAHDYSDRVK